MQWHIPYGYKYVRDVSLPYKYHKLSLYIVDIRLYFFIAVQTQVAWFIWIALAGQVMQSWQQQRNTYGLQMCCWNYTDGNVLNYLEEFAE